MIGLVIVSHGEMAEGAIDAVRMIVGDQEQMVGIKLEEGDAVEQLESRIREAVEDVDGGDGVLVLVDLFGATPLNVSANVAAERDDLDVITGFNLPMLLEIAMERTTSSVAELVEIGEGAGAEGIKVLSKVLEEASS